MLHTICGIQQRRKMTQRAVMSRTKASSSGVEASDLEAAIRRYEAGCSWALERPLTRRSSIDLRPMLHSARTTARLKPTIATHRSEPVDVPH
jgi:hypothetical protein